MPALTRHRDPDVAQETWRVHFDHVHVRTIAECVGNPGAACMWQWRCGFYPGSRPGECTGGTAATFEEARADFEAAWRRSSPSEPLKISKRSAISAIGPRANMRRGRQVAVCLRCDSFRLALARKHDLLRLTDVGGRCLL